MGIRKDAADERFGSTTATTDAAKGVRAGCLQGEGINTGRYAVTINHVKNSLRQARRGCIIAFWEAFIKHSQFHGTTILLNALRAEIVHGRL